MLRRAGIDFGFKAHGKFKEGNPMKLSNGLAYLRQLCCSGLGKEIIIPEFLRAVQTVLPSGNNAFTGVDELLNPTFHIFDFVAAQFDERTFHSHFQFITPERGCRAPELLSQQAVLTDWTFLDASFYSPNLYNQIFRCIGKHHCLNAPVMQAGKPVGILNLCRPLQQKPFDSREQALFTHLLPYVAHALRAPDDLDVQYSETGSSGMMIIDTQGAILYLCHEAKLLLVLACHPILTMDARSKEVELLTKLAQFCRIWRLYFSAKIVPPSWCFISPNGRFIFRAYWLNKQNNEPDGLLGLTVEHQEPLALKILRAMQGLPLSPTQKEVAMLLAQKTSSEKIAKRLHIKPSTVKDHIGKIFTKLDIHHREELLPKLLALDNSKL